ncbi:MAG: alpha-hydroxy-acid oxidizing enzyme, partial [Actinobacteria bacterium]|nr:alpha-hydroxy-acid oxidizing enzyme [Actinomycetota bacterium]
MSKNVKRQFPKWADLSPLLKFTMPTLPSREKRLAKALTIWDLREIAKRRTPKGPFDYTDGAAESEVTLERARRAYLDLELRPNILRNVKDVSLECEVLGQRSAMPVGLAPTGFTRMMHSEGENAVARAAQKFGIPYTLSTLGTTTIEDVVTAAPDGTNWFQLYMWNDRDASMQLVERARKAGVKNLLLTVDVPVAGARYRDTRNGLTVPPSLTAKTILDAIPRPEWWMNFLTTPAISFVSMKSWNGTVAELLDFMFDPTMTFEDLKWIRSQWDGKLTIKGIQTVEDAKKSADCGADAIILSNHGGRQIDRGPIPLHLLADVKKELKNELEVHLDTGIMNGADILAAIALGADFTYIGRAYLYGL